VIIDAFTKFVRLYPAKTTKSREAIVALKDYFRSYSRPRCVISDRGTCFTSKEFHDLEENEVKHIKIATGSPQSNGQAERVNRSIGPMSAKLTECLGVSQKGKVIDSLKEKLEELNKDRESRNLEVIREKATQSIEKLQEYIKLRTDL